VNDEEIDMGNMKQLDIMLQNMERDVLEDGPRASCAMEGIGTFEPRVAYTMDDLIATFGCDFEMFGELMVGTPECEMCWCQDGTPVEAHYVWIVPELEGRDAVLFTCLECE